jgi:O-antigen ligase
MPVFSSFSLKAKFAPRGGSVLRSALPVLLASALLFSFVSISCSQIFLFLSFLVWSVGLVRKEWRWAVPSFFWPLAGYAALSLLAAFLSVNPGMSLSDSKELLLFLVVPLFATGLTAVEDIGLAARAVLVSGTASSLYSLGYAVLKAAPGQRISGFVGHYMTQGGLLLLFGALAVSVFMFWKSRERFIWGAAFIVSAVALALTYTRSAWVGFAVVLAFLLSLSKPKALILLPVLGALAFAVSPSTIRYRVLSIFNPDAYSNHLRIEYFKAGVKIIKDFPLHGTGPDTVDLVFQDPKYGLSEDAKKNVHLHNNLTQIAAERGIPALLAWLLFMGWSFACCLKFLKDKNSPVYSYAAAAAAAVLAVFVAGMFEYNFGDSEVLTLFLVLITIPFAGPRRLKDFRSDRIGR